MTQLIISTLVVAIILGTYLAYLWTNAYPSDYEESVARRHSRHMELTSAYITFTATHDRTPTARELWDASPHLYTSKETN